MLVFTLGCSPSFLIYQICSERYIFDLENVSEFDAINLVNDLQAKEVLFHINLTYPEKVYSKMSRLIRFCKDRNIIILNHLTRDISKVAIQQANINLGLPYTSIEDSLTGDADVIVKTNLNYAGRPERFLSDKVKNMYEIRNTANCPIHEADGYQVLKLGELDFDPLAKSDLVAEKYIRNSGDFFIRVYKFKDKIVISRAKNINIIKKWDNYSERINVMEKEAIVSDELFREVYENVEKLSSYMSVQYCAVDVVFCDDLIPYIIDLNITPGWGIEIHREVIDALKA